MQPIIGISEEDQEEFAQQYIAVLGRFLLTSLSQKYLQIPQLGGLYLHQNQQANSLDQSAFHFNTSQISGALQLIQDIAYMKKTLKQFVMSAQQDFPDADSQTLSDEQPLQPHDFAQLNSI